MPDTIPGATYRLQFAKDFGFRSAAGLVPYLKVLGITHIYASPFLRARTGSTHGYDVVDHNQLDPQYGGEEDFDQLAAALAEADMGLILDFVPNHMGVSHEDNAWWLDVLEWGPYSPYARYFDIDWHNVPGRSRPAVVLPLLGKPYGEALGAGELKLSFDSAAGSFSVRYFDHRLPVRPADYPALLETMLDRTEAGLQPFLQRRADLVSDRTLAAQLKATLAKAGARIEAAIENDGPDAAHRLHRLLLRQYYVPAYWRSSASEINYRRFFDINDLAGLRMEDRKVFADTHGLVGRLIRDGRLHGLRLDHIDGLYDPVRYCRELGKLAEGAGRRAGDFYILIEKILGEGEDLPEFPYVAGTTGYEWLNAICGLLTSNDGLGTLEEAWREFTGELRSYHELKRAAKTEAIAVMFAGELQTLVRLLRRIAAGNRRSQDFSADHLRAALLAYVGALPVYRTYVTPENGASAQDREIVRAAIEAARRAEPRIGTELFSFLADLLTLDILKPERHGYSTSRVCRFVGKLQQFTGPVMAKALEDTCFYRHFRLISFNEVGGHPDGAGLNPADFHRLMQQRIDQQPHGLTATATHDTKRGEDARTRIAALSELAGEWRDAVRRWSSLNKRLVSSGHGPASGHQYLLYQALLGAWPAEGPDKAFADRAVAYAVKATREGKQETSWHYPDADYEHALEGFIRGVLDPAQSADFISDFDAMARRVALLGGLNSLSQVAIKLAMPGVPDIYQGSEFWDLSFVDPDNRRPVDYAARQTLQSGLNGGIDWPGLAASWQDGRIKFALLQTMLRLRRAHHDLFTNGDYRTVSVQGRNAGSVMAFSRTLGQKAVVIAVGRLMAGLTDGGRRWPRGQDWGDTAILLPDEQVFCDHLRSGSQRSQNRIPLSDGFRDFPVAVYISGG